MVQFIGNRWVESCETRFRKKADTPSLNLNGLVKIGKRSNKTRFQHCKNSNNVLLNIRAVQGHTGGKVIAPELMGPVTVRPRWKEFLYHRGCSFDVTSILRAGLIAGGKARKKQGDSILHAIRPFWRLKGKKKNSKKKKTQRKKNSKKKKLELTDDNIIS